jgi:putative effector of murein hydrolase
MVRTEQARKRHSVPWPILAVAAFAAALYEAISRHAPPWAVAMISVFAALQVAMLAMWVFALWHNRRLDREEG